MSKKRNHDDDVPSLPNPPSLIEYGDMRFLIFDAPSDDNVDVYAKVRSVQSCNRIRRIFCFHVFLFLRVWIFEQHSSPLFGSFDYSRFSNITM